jgi:FtsH-binding integral membrane protein
MQERDYFGRYDTKEQELNRVSSFSVLMRKVYTWMAMALVITGVTAYGVANSPALIQAIYGNPVLFFGLIIGELALVWGVSARIHKLSLTTATLLFILYSVINGVTLSSIFIVYASSTISEAFLITAGTFGGMSILGYTTKRDLSKLGSYLLMALIGIIIASVVNIFLKSSGFDLILSYLVVLVFVGLTAWDTQNIKNMLEVEGDTGEGAQKVALLGALTLYLDFINLFLHILRILGNSRD